MVPQSDLINKYIPLCYHYLWPIVMCHSESGLLMTLILIIDLAITCKCILKSALMRNGSQDTVFGGVTDGWEMFSFALPYWITCNTL